MIAKEGADRIGEYQGVIDFLRHVFIGHHPAIHAELRPQNMRGFVISDRFNGVGLQIRHIH